MTALRALKAAVGLLGLGLLAGARAAETADAQDLATIKACVERQENARASAETCISIIAKPCLGNNEDTAIPSDIVQCYGREEQAWDELLKAAYKGLHDNLDSDRQTKLRDMQRSWLEARKRTCEFFYDYFQGSMAYPMIASCQNTETARRAIFLRIFARDVAGGK